MTTPLVAFPGFRPAAFAFFRGLSQHNDPAWFRPKKTIYEAEVLAPLRQLVVAVGAAKGPEVGDYVCWKSFPAHAGLSDDEMQSPALVARILGFARTLWPLLEWGWAAAEDEGAPPLVIRAPVRPLPKPDF